MGGAAWPRQGTGLGWKVAVAEEGWSVETGRRLEPEERQWWLQHLGSRKILEMRFKPSIKEEIINVA